MIRHCKRLIAISLVVVFICAFAPAGPALAADGNDCSLTVVYSGERGPVSGSSFSIRQIGSTGEDGKLTINEPFSGYSLDFDQTDAGGWRILANTLEAYILRDRVPASDQKTTDQNGKLSFTGLPRGLYLLSGERAEVDGFSYTPEPMFIILPGEGEGEPEYDVVVEPKKEVVPLTEEEKITVSVIKVWNDGGNSADRPAEIEVDLFCDGERYDSAVLDNVCRWRAKWEDLDPTKKWTVAEKTVPTGYRVSVERENTLFVVTNTRTIVKSAHTDEPKLPQTGMLLWPVAVLAVLGSVSFLAGMIVTKRSDKS